MSNKLDQIQIPAPCPADWEEMAGNDRMRYCAECKKNVYNISKMTRFEAEALIATKRGGLCARIVRNADGIIMTDEATSFRSTHRRVSPVATAVVTAILTINSGAVAQPTIAASKPLPTVAQESGVSRPEIKPRSEGGTNSIAGTITDQSGAVIVIATVRLTNKTTGHERIASISEDGEYRFTDVAAGAYSLKVEAAGFKSVQNESIAVEQGSDIRLDVTMTVGVISGGLVVALPLPLRTLYDKSELVVVARAVKSVRVQTKGEASLMKTRLQVSSTHKGEERARAIDLYHLVYGEEDEIYNKGGNLLLFLKRRQGEQGGSKQGYELADSMRGVKELPEGDLRTYLQRTDELAAIMSKGNPSREEIVEWLVRCAEHPATRWDGVYDLDLNAADLAKEPVDEIRGEAEEAVEEEAVEGEVVEEEPTKIETDEEDPDEEDQGEKLFDRLLTAEQKERLTQALLNTQTITRDDLPLIDLVQRWDDGRLMPFLLSQLRKMEANPPRMAAQVMGSIANWLEDEEVLDAYDRYNNNVSYADEDEEIDEGEGAAASKIAWLEARQSRGDILREFIALAESKVKK